MRSPLSTFRQHPGLTAAGTAAALLISGSFVASATDASLRTVSSRKQASSVITGNNDVRVEASVFVLNGELWAEVDAKTKDRDTELTCGEEIPGSLGSLGCDYSSQRESTPQKIESLSLKVEGQTHATTEDARPLSSRRVANAKTDAIASATGDVVSAEGVVATRDGKIPFSTPPATIRDCAPTELVLSFGSL